MCPIFNGCGDTAVRSWRVQIRFLSVGMDEKRSLQRKVNRRYELVACIMNSAALIKQEHQDDLRRATCTVAMRVDKCTEVDGGIFEHLL
jgi:hypothetical protein